MAFAKNQFLLMWGRGTQDPAKFCEALCSLLDTGHPDFSPMLVGGRLVSPDLMGLCPHLSYTSGVTGLKRVTSAIPCAPGTPAWPLMLFQHVAFN